MFSSKDALVQLFMLFFFSPGIVPKMHVLENSYLNKTTPIVSERMSKESRFPFNNLGQEFVSCLNVIQYAQVSPSNLSAALFDSTTIQLLLILFCHLTF